MAVPPIAIAKPAARWHSVQNLEARQVQTEVAHSHHPEHGCDGCDSKSCSDDADPEPIVFGCRGHEDWDQGFTGAEHENDEEGPFSDRL